MGGEGGVGGEGGDGGDGGDGGLRYSTKLTLPEKPVARVWTSSVQPGAVQVASCQPSP